MLNKYLLAVTAIILLSHILLVQGALAGDPNDGLYDPDTQDLTDATNSYNNAEIYDSYLNAAAPNFPDYVDNEFPKTSYADWDQGRCGDCWVWSCTAAVAQSYRLYSGNDIPLSVQFFNSNYFAGNIGQVLPHDWACTSGTPTEFVNSYNAGLNQSYPDGPFVVPWSNANASFVDRNIFSPYYSTTYMPKDLISTTPHLHFTSMRADRVADRDLTNTTKAIDDLTELLAEGRVVVYTLYYPDDPAASDFFNFWDYGNNSGIYDPSTMDGRQWNQGSGHAMVIVGYDKTDANQDNWYWIVQNSAGVNTNRTLGQFRLKMVMDYNASYYYPAIGNTGGQPLQQFWTINVDWTPVQEPVSNDAGSDEGQDSYVATSTPVSAGQSMGFAINEPVTSGDPVGIVSVDVIPDTALGSTDLTVADTDTADESAFAGRQVADIESINLVAVNPSSIRGGTITFAVSGNWMRDHGVKTDDIVLMRNHDGSWAELPTTFDHVAEDTYYFTATTPGFSSFAVVTKLNTTATVNATPSVSGTATVPVASTEITSSLTSPVPTTAAAATTVMTKTTTVPQTTAVPAPAAAPSGSSGIPALWVVAGIFGIAIAVAGGLFVRRWWIHRQNPALFRKYD